KASTLQGPPIAPLAGPASSPAGDLPPLGTPDAKGGSWKLWNEETTTRPIVDAIDGAKSVVNVEFFGFSDGGKGSHVVNALERAARRGVEVNVFTDATSIPALPLGSYFKMKSRIEDAGGTVKNNVRLPVVYDHDDTPGLKHVDHRKVVTVDGKTAFVGGINFIKLEDGFHDSMLQLSGVDAARLAADQLDRWSRVGGAVSQRHREGVTAALAGAALVPTSPTAMRIVANAPEQGRSELTDGYRDLIRSAKTRLWISSPGWSDQELIEELNQAAARGVDVRLVAPGKPPLGIPLINWVGQSHLRELVGHGAKAIEIPEVLHRKALIADDEVIFSSFNVTGRSKTADHEVGVRTKDPEFVAAIAGVLQRDMDRGTAITAESGSRAGRTIGNLIAQRFKISY
ncbi:MAG: cardiolipin synthase, partial [Thermoleophilia bacterium]|nr:cardiolipin synthase [Thermoleophilia bacterium]